MTTEQLNELKSKLLDVIANGKGIDHKLHLMGEVDVLVAEYKQLQAFYNYFSELYGKGLEVANWHLNGDLEPFDEFFVSAEENL
jgi:hypothetical protein